MTESQTYTPAQIASADDKSTCAQCTTPPCNCHAHTIIIVGPAPTTAACCCWPVTPKPSPTQPETFPLEHRQPQHHCCRHCCRRLKHCCRGCCQPAATPLSRHRCCSRGCCCCCCRWRWLPGPSVEPIAVRPGGQCGSAPVGMQRNTAAGCIGSAAGHAFARMADVVERHPGLCVPQTQRLPAQAGPDCAVQQRDMSAACSTMEHPHYQ